MRFSKMFTCFLFSLFSPEVSRIKSDAFFFSFVFGFANFSPSHRQSLSSLNNIDRITLGFGRVYTLRTTFGQRVSWSCTVRYLVLSFFPYSDEV